MGLRFFINDANNVVSATPLGGAIAEASSPIPIYNVITGVQWQFGSADLQGIYRPLRKDTSATTTFKWDFLPITVFTGTATFGLDPASIVRPTSGTGTGYLINQPLQYAVGARSLALDTGSGTILAGDYVYIGHFEYLVETGITSPGSILLAFPGLREVVPDNIPVTIDTEAGFYTANLAADTVASTAYLATFPANDAAPVAAVLSWYESGDDTSGPPRTSSRTYGTLLNTFATSGVSPSPGANAGNVFLASIVGITGGGVTKLDGIPTLGKGWNAVSFIDSTTGTGYRVYQLGADDGTTVGRVATSDDITKVWYSRN